MNTYSDFFKVISQYPHSRNGQKARKFIMTQISDHRLSAMKSSGYLRQFNNREANRLEKTLYIALAGEY